MIWLIIKATVYNWVYLNQDTISGNSNQMEVVSSEASWHGFSKKKSKISKNQSLIPTINLK